LSDRKSTGFSVGPAGKTEFDLHRDTIAPRLILVSRPYEIRLPDASTTCATIKPANLWATSVRSRPVTHVLAEREREKERERERKGGHLVVVSKMTKTAAITDYESDNNNIVAKLIDAIILGKYVIQTSLRSSFHTRALSSLYHRLT